MKAGFFATTITPPIGTMQAGNYSPAYLRGAAGDLKIRTAVFEKNGQHVAFAVVDSCTIDRSLINQAMEAYGKMNGPHLESFIISATHTHSGAAVSSFVQTDLIDKMSPEVQELFKYTARPDEWFTAFVARQLATAIFMAASRLEPAVISTGKGLEQGFTFNRRFICKDGRAYTHPGTMNPDIVKPAGSVDPMVGVLGAWREDGSLIGAMVNFCCHGTAYSGPLAQADWIEFVDETIKKLFGDKVGVVVLNGPCGDVTQVDNQSRARDFGLDIARRLGFRVGAEAAKVLVSSVKQTNPTLKFADSLLGLTRRVPCPDSLTAAWAQVNAHRDTPAHTDAIFARERLFAAELQRLQPVKQAPLTAIQIGDALFLSIPAEFFTSLSLRIKAASPFDNTMIVELANDCIGYVPDADAFNPRTGGGYETCLTGYSNMGVDSGERLVEALVAMSKNFTPDQIAPDESKRPGTYWSYGSRGPDLD